MKIIHTTDRNTVLAIRDLLHEFNLRKTDGKKPRPVIPDTPARAAFAAYQDGEILPSGGLVYHLEENGRIFFVDFLWISEALRGHGMGARLLALAKEKAESLGCEAIELFTYFFQAPDFYPKMGYTLARIEEKEIPGYGLSKVHYFSMKLKP